MLRAPMLAVALVGVAYAGSSQAAPPASVSATDARTFVPGTVNVDRTGTVTWTNTGNQEEHTVTSNTAGLFNGPLTNNGDTFSRQFNQAGKFRYHCEIHGFDMSGTVVVPATRSGTPPPPSGERCPRPTRRASATRP